MFKLDADKQVPEPYTEEAKFFVEARLLQRDVKIILEGESHPNLLGTVLHPVSGGACGQFLFWCFDRLFVYSRGNALLL